MTYRAALANRADIFAAIAQDVCMVTSKDALSTQHLIKNYSLFIVFGNGTNARNSSLNSSR